MLLERGAAALASFQVNEALPLLEEARTKGPLPYADHVRLWEQLGIAYAYLGREESALDAFDMLLALAPAHLLSYALSPKVTFLFERARARAAGRAATTVDVSWPYELEVSEPVPIDVEVVNDPRGLLARARLFVRRRGDDDWRVLDLVLPTLGDRRRVFLPALRSARPEVIEIWLVAFDRAGNEVLQWAGPSRPRAIALSYRPPTPWYRRWWVWAIVGGALTAGTGTTVYLMSQEPPDVVGGDFTVDR